MKLLAIDGNSIINRAFYGVRQLANKNGVFTNAIFGFFNIMLKLQKDLSPDEIVFAFDMKAKTFRHLQYDGYKAQRKGMPEELAQQFPLVKDIVRLLGYKIVEKEGFEADDVLGTLGKICAESENECIIATGDRDALQLVSDNVKVCLIKTKENIVYDVKRLIEEYGVNPIDLIEVKALMGDTSDNIPGVKGIGEKTALTLIQKNVNIDNIYADVEAIEATPRIKKLLSESKENAFLSRDLARICVDVPIGLSCTELARGEVAEDELSMLLTELEMFSFFDKLGVKRSNEVSENKKINETICEIISDVQLSQLTQIMNEVDRVDVIIDESIIKINVKKRIYLVENSDEALRAILNCEKPIRTTVAKKLYKLALGLGISTPNINFDVELAAYLLSAAGKDYSVLHLAQKYLPHNNYNVNEELFDIAALSDLCDSLSQMLEQEDMQKLYSEIELPLSLVLASMEHEGFAVDKEGIEQFSQTLGENITVLKAIIFEHAGEEFNPNSTKELGRILFEKLGLPAKKKTKTGYSTNADVLESLKGKHEIIEAILEYRKLTKLQSTYAVGLLKVVGEDGRVHSTFNQTETRTGRISSTEPNVQNIPVRTKLGSKMREFFTAKEDYVLVDADYSQIELRILAHIANDKDMIDGFANGLDIHAITASQVFNTPLEEVSSTQRSNAKAINFGIVYGIGPFSLSKDIGVSMYEAKEYINQYLQTYAGVDEYMKKIVVKAEEDGFVRTLYNRKRELADISNTNKTKKAFAERMALNTPIQGSAADIIKIAMIRVYNRLEKEKLDAKLILQVHDELIVEAHESVAKTVQTLLKEEMQNAADLSVTLVVDAHLGKTWYEAKNG